MSEQKRQMLVTFIHPVAIIIGNCAIFIHAAFVEEVFKGAIEATPLIKKGMSAEQAAETVVRMPLDFPLFLNIVAEPGGRVVNPPQQIMVKYNNIASILDTDFGQVIFRVE